MHVQANSKNIVTEATNRGVLLKKLFLKISQYSCEFHEVFNNTFFIEHLRWLFWRFSTLLFHHSYFVFGTRDFSNSSESKLDIIISNLYL